MSSKVFDKKYFSQIIEDKNLKIKKFELEFKKYLTIQLDKYFRINVDNYINLSSFFIEEIEIQIHNDDVYNLLHKLDNDVDRKNSINNVISNFKNDVLNLEYLKHYSEDSKLGKFIKINISMKLNKLI